MRMGLCKRNIIAYKYRHIIYRIYFYIIFLLTFAMCVFMLGKVRNAFLKVFTPYAINIGSDAINFTVADYFAENNYDYNDFVTLSYNNNNEISSVQANSALMNKVKAELSIYLQDKITELKTTELSMPIGNMFDNIVLHGFGPNIKIKVSAMDITDLNFNDSFEDAGINQVRHRIFIDAYVTLSINCASMTKSEVIHDTIPVAETVIVGQVPKYYSTNKGFDILPNEREE
ncbi:MAG: sporulation protein YunB [Clostridia bacterium]|nr:sporulation protein YunB [Clostridia bacterium]